MVKKEKGHNDTHRYRCVNLITWHLRAGIASFTLFLSGCETMYSLGGHMKGWRKNAFPIEEIKSKTETGQRLAHLH
jgi:hypothetical protein